MYDAMSYYVLCDKILTLTTPVGARRQTKTTSNSEMTDKDEAIVFQDRGEKISTISMKLGISDLVR